MLTVFLVLFVAVVLYSLLKGELEYVRDSLEIQLRQARFRIDRLERRVRDLEEPAASSPQPNAAAPAPQEPDTLTTPEPGL
jgi:hypothetical protein